MQFLESTNFFVRVTVYDYCNRLENINLKFRLIPMVHIGEQSFYDAIREKILECDEIIYEGIKRKKKFRLLNSRSYLSKRLGLVEQAGALKLKGEDIKLTHGDYTEFESEIEWKKVRFSERIKEKFKTPFERYADFSQLTRKQLAKYFMNSYEENYLAYGPRFDELGTLENYYMAEREKIVLNLILERISTQSKEKKLIGILYGAGHMDRFSRHLIDKRKYHVCNGEFVKVFDVY